MRAFKLAVALFAAVACCFAVGGDNSGFKAIQDRVVEHKLENGLTLLILPRREAPVFSFATVVDVGAVDDPQGQSGMAHMFEHMAFKGTTYIGTTDAKAEIATFDDVDKAFLAMKAERIKGRDADPKKLEELKQALKDAQEKAGKYVVTNEFGQIIDRFGGVGLNATTGADATTYFYSMPSNKLELWMSLESERFIDPVMREFYKEADVVKEERRMRTEDSPFGKLIEEFLNLAFKAHHYSVSGIGHMSDLSSFTREQGLAFYEKYYVPANITIALVGDLDPKKTIKMAETYFGRMKAGPDPGPIETIEPKQEAERIVKVYGQGQNIAMMGYHIPDGRHPDAPVYDAMSSILSAGRTSRLYKRLVSDEKSALFAGGFSGFPGNKYPSLFLFFAIPNQGKTNDDVLGAMEEEVERLKNEPVSEQELKRVKTQARAQLLRGLNSNQGLAFQLASVHTQMGHWSELFKSLEKIESVTADDIQRVARETFIRNNRTVGYYIPETEADAGGGQ